MDSFELISIILLFIVFVGGMSYMIYNSIEINNKEIKFCKYNNYDISTGRTSCIKIVNGSIEERKFEHYNGSIYWKVQHG